MPPHPSMWYTGFVYVLPHHSTSCCDGGFLLSHSWHSSPTLFTSHASRTHVKALQTVFTVKPDNSSGPTHGSPSERPLRTKATFQPKKHRKASRTPSRERTTQARHGPTLLHALTRSGIGTKARRAASRPRPYPPRCSEPWKKPRRHQVGLHGSMSRSPKPSRLGSEAGFGFSLFGKKDLSFFLSLIYI